MKAKRLLILPALFLVLVARPLTADTVTWGGGVGDIFQFSNGSSVGSSTWFELGTFDSFTPTSSNIADWAANWQVFDRATATLGDNQFSPGPPAVLSGLADINPDGTSSKAASLALPPGHPNELINFDPNYNFTGKKAYVWVFNDRSAGLGAEWGLFTGEFLASTDEWKFPTADPDCGCLLPVDFNLADISVDILGSSAQGSQTTLALAPVPEPSGALLLVAAAMVFIVRQRSRLRR